MRQLALPRRYLPPPFLPLPPPIVPMHIALIWSMSLVPAAAANSALRDSSPLYMRYFTLYMRWSTLQA